MSEAGMSEAGFVLGDHRFLHPSVQGPLSRMYDPKRQIKGAPPPTYLEGRAVEAGPDSLVASALLEGRFCGHNEPTMTVFEVVIDGHADLEIGAVLGDEGLAILAVRAPGSDEWFAVYRDSWAEEQQTLEGVDTPPMSAEEIAQIDPDIARGRVAIGFEYPCDATSRDCVSWMTIDALIEGQDEPGCVVNAELA
ncbi:MAG: hypothetical protein ACF8R9_08310 [Phycisphaerales bacterium JB054]